MTKNGTESKVTTLGGFDPQFYLNHNPDVANAAVDPMQHFIEYGWREGRDPCRHFSVRGYLQHNPDVEAAGVNPLLHFWEHGLSEGRTGWKVPDVEAPRTSETTTRSPKSAPPSSDPAALPELSLEAWAAALKRV